MKLCSMILFTCALTFAACGGGKKADTMTDPNTSTSNADDAGAVTPTGDGQPCTQEIAMECPEGQIDGCLKQPPEGTVHACVAK